MHKLSKRSKKGLVVAAIGVVALGIVMIGEAICRIQMKRECLGHLKRAADAVSIELALTELNTAVGYLEHHGLTEGYTSVIYTTPAEDIGFWYQNLKACQHEMSTIPADATALERSNVLMKLRETLLDSHSTGDRLTVPQGIAWYPHNKPLGLISTIFVMIALAGVILYCVGAYDYK